MGEKQQVVKNMQKFEKQEALDEEQTGFLGKLKALLAFLTKSNDILLDDLGKLHVRAQEARIKKICASLIDPANKNDDVIVAEGLIAQLVPGYPNTFVDFCGNY